MIVSLDTDSESNSWGDSRISDSAGHFTFTGVPDGTYRLQTYPVWNASPSTDYYLDTYRGTAGATTDYNAAAIITVAGGAIVAQDIEAIAGAVVSGKLTGAGADLTVYGNTRAEQKKAGSWQWSGWGSFDYSTSTYHLVTPAGSTRLSFFADGFRAEYYDNVVDAADATPVALVGGERRTIDVDLAPGPKISGTVFIGGSAVQNDVYVCAHPIGNYYAARCVWTDSSGRYSIGSGLDTASYNVEVSYDGYLTTYYAAGGSVAVRNQAGVVDLGASLQQTGIDLHLIRGATVSGTVSRSSGPIANASVCDDSGESRCDYTDDGGHYSLQVAPGTVKLRASYHDDYDNFAFVGDTGPLSVVDGSTYPNTNIVLGEGTGLTGTVSRSYGVDVDAAVYRVTAGHETFVDNRWLDSEKSTFAFRDLEPGSYVVRFSADGHEGACAGGAACSPITVTQGAITDIGTTTLTPFASGSVAGKVLDSSGTALAGVSVEVDIDGVSQTVSTGADGSYLLSDLPSKLSHEVTFSLAGYTPTTRSVEPRPGVTVPLSAVHLLAFASVNGVIAVPAGGDPTAVSLYLDGPGYYWTTPEADGSYTFANVAPGRYYLRASSSDDSTLSEWYPGVKSSGDAPRLVVAEGSALTLDPFALRVPASVSGSLSDGSDPVSGTVRLYDDDGVLVDSTWMSSSTFNFDDLWPGRYTIRATASSTAFRNTWLGNVTSMALADRITLAEGEASSGHSITMVPRAGGPVSGRVVAHDGTTGVSDVDVATGAEDAMTGTDGSFTTGFVPQGTYPVSLYLGNGTAVCGSDLALTCNPAEVTVGASGASDLSFVLPQLGSVTGVISGPAGAVPGAEVWLEDANGESIAFDDTDAGAFTLSGIPYGTYTLVAQANGLATSSVSVVVDGAETANLALGARHTISGTVTVQAAAEWLNVELIDPTTGDLVDSTEFEAVEPGAIPYSFDNVTDGDQYWVRVVANHDRAVWYANADNPLSATKVSANGADVTGIDLTLPAPDDWYTVSGVVTVPAGTTIDDSFDVCFDATKRDDGNGYEDCTTPAPDGSYSLAVPAGTYIAAASAPAPSGLVSSRKDVELTSNTTVDFTLPLGGSLTGRLVDSSGVGVEGEVTVSDGVSQFWSDTDEFGYWTVDAIPVGNVTVTASADGFTDFTSGATHTITAGGVTDAGNQVLSAAGNLRIGIASLSGVSSTKVTAVVTTADGQTELARESLWTGDDPEDGEITGLAAGQVKVRFFGPKVKTEWWKDATTADMATEVTIVNDVTKTIRPVLSPADPALPATVSGVITNNTGRDGVVRLTAIDQDDVATDVEVTATDGSYSVSLAPGIYRFRAAVCTGMWMGASGCLGKTVVAWYHGNSGDDAEHLSLDSGGTLTGINLSVGNLRTFAVGTATITGTAQVGQTLIASPGTWTPADGTFAYRWFRDGDTLGTGSTYRVTASDLGKTVSMEVSATKNGYSKATSAPVVSEVVVAGTLTDAKPSIDGQVKVGTKLTAKSGAWTDGTAFSYLWKVGGIDSGTADTYTPVVADLGKTITVTVTGTLDGYLEATRTSDESAAVAKGSLAASKPTIEGSGTVGQTVTAKPGTWTDGATLTYQWKRNGAAIDGATQSSYQLGEADAGTTVTVTVAATMDGYDPAEQTSAGLAVQRLQLGAGTVSIQGSSFNVGVTLTAVPSGWPAAATLSYQWKRNGAAIAGATGATYTPQAADLNTKLSVAVTGTVAGLDPASAESSQVGPIQAALKALKKGTVKISGTVKVGKKLTAKVAKWSPSGIKYSYQWLRNGVEVAGATKSSYKLAKTDKSFTFQVRVTASKAGYASIVVTSKSTSRVK